VTSFFAELECVKVSGFCFFLESDKTDLCQFIFQGLGENTCSLQPALKNTAPGLKDRVHCISMQVVMNKCFLLNLSFSRKTHL